MAPAPIPGQAVLLAKGAAMLLTQLVCFVALRLSAPHHEGWAD
jgi:hypothetical protein